jgi:hypothetical protein
MFGAPFERPVARPVKPVTRSTHGSPVLATTVGGCDNPGMIPEEWRLYELVRDNQLFTDDFTVLWVSPESGGFNLAFAQRLGIEMDRVTVALEQDKTVAYRIAKDAARSHKYGLVILDHGPKA